MSDAYYRLVLMVGVLAVLIWSAIGPHDRVTWWLETAPVWAGLAVLIFTHQRFPLTRLAYTLIAVHMLILCVGGHYTYALVPAGEWVRDMVEGTRNNYDKLGHFWQGFCPAIVARELIVRTSPLRSGGWLYFLVLCFALALSAVYELIEWAAALVFGGDLGVHYLGTQGDVWDGQRDMALAALGAVLAMLWPMVRQRRAARPQARRPVRTRRGVFESSSSALDTGVRQRAAACRRGRRVECRT